MFCFLHEMLFIRFSSWRHSTNQTGNKKIKYTEQTGKKLGYQMGHN